MRVRYLNAQFSYYNVYTVESQSNNGLKICYLNGQTNQMIKLAIQITD